MDKVVIPIDRYEELVKAETLLCVVRFLCADNKSYLACELLEGMKGGKDDGSSCCAES